jgi:hypothetical protein
MQVEDGGRLTTVNAESFSSILHRHFFDLDGAMEALMIFLQVGRS